MRKTEYVSELPHKIELVDHMGDDSSIVNAARVSYKEGTKHFRSDRALIRYLMMNGHMSPFEFVEFTFYVSAPIFVARQWFRHRTGNFAEKSGRYSEMAQRVYAPTHLELADDAMAIVSLGNIGNALEAIEVAQMAAAAKAKGVMDNSTTTYRHLLESGVVREQARAVLPMATMTEFYYKTDLRNLMHFLKLRMDEHAQREIRVYANAIFDMVREVVPEAMSAFEEYILDSVALSKSEWEALVKRFGAREVFQALVGVDPSRSRAKALEQLVGV